MSVTFPSFPQGTTTKITLRSNAVDLTPTFQGPTQRILRLGDRWVYEVDMRAMRADQAAAITNALLQGLGDTLVIAINDGQDWSAYSNGTVSSGGASGGTSLNHSGGGGTKKVGQFFSISKGGKRYLHRITAVSGSTLTFLPALKISVSNGDTLEFGAPKLEGFIEGNEQGWQVGLVANVGVSFRIVEAQ